MTLTIRAMKGISRIIEMIQEHGNKVTYDTLKTLVYIGIVRDSVTKAKIAFLVEATNGGISSGKLKSEGSVEGLIGTAIESFRLSAIKYLEDATYGGKKYDDNEDTAYKIVLDKRPMSERLRFIYPDDIRRLIEPNLGRYSDIERFAKDKSVTTADILLKF